MARPLRREFPGAAYHVTTRGNARTDIFEDDIDRNLFCSVLGQVVKHFNRICHAYCLMSTHYHLLLEPPDGNLSAGKRQKPDLLIREWVLSNFSSSLRKARSEYQQFVKDGIEGKESPWEKLSGQIVFDSETFLHKLKDLLGEKEGISDLPSVQRSAGRPSLAGLFPVKDNLN